VASLSQGRTAAAQCGLFTYKSVPVIFEPPCIFCPISPSVHYNATNQKCILVNCLQTCEHKTNSFSLNTLNGLIQQTNISVTLEFRPCQLLNTYQSARHNISKDWTL